MDYRSFHKVFLHVTLKNKMVVNQGKNERVKAEILIRIF